MSCKKLVLIHNRRNSGMKKDYFPFFEKFKRQVDDLLNFIYNKPKILVQNK